METHILVFPQLLPYCEDMAVASEGIVMGIVYLRIEEH
jgi:hypothetical protein